MILLFHNLRIKIALKFESDFFIDIFWEVLVLQWPHWGYFRNCQAALSKLTGLDPSHFAFQIGSKSQNSKCFNREIK